MGCKVENPRGIAGDQVTEHFDKVKNGVRRAYIADAVKGRVIVVQELPFERVGRQGWRVAALPLVKRAGREIELVAGFVEQLGKPRRLFAVCPGSLIQRQIEVPLYSGGGTLHQTRRELLAATADGSVLGVILAVTNDQAIAD
jgi:hypothetical protein